MVPDDEPSLLAKIGYAFLAALVGAVLVDGVTLVLFTVAARLSH